MKKTKGPAKFPPKNAVFEARRHAVALTLERDRAIQALRNSNAVAAYLLRLAGSEVKIPLTDYKQLLDDDAITMSVAYVGDEAVVQFHITSKPVRENGGKRA